MGLRVSFNHFGLGGGFHLGLGFGLGHGGPHMGMGFNQPFMFAAMGGAPFSPFVPFATDFPGFRSWEPPAYAGQPLFYQRSGGVDLSNPHSIMDWMGSFGTLPQAPPLSSPPPGAQQVARAKPSMS